MSWRVARQYVELPRNYFETAVLLSVLEASHALTKDFLMLFALLIILRLIVPAPSETEYDTCIVVCVQHLYNLGETLLNVLIDPFLFFKKN